MSWMEPKAGLSRPRGGKYTTDQMREAQPLPDHREEGPKESEGKLTLVTHRPGLKPCLPHPHPTP